MIDALPCGTVVEIVFQVRQECSHGDPLKNYTRHAVGEVRPAAVTVNLLDRLCERDNNTVGLFVGLPAFGETLQQRF
jgi:hypothetical protein